MSKVAKVETGAYHSAQQDVIVTLDDGRVIHVSPEFDAINVFRSREDFEEFHVGDDAVQTFDLPVFQ